MHRAWQGTNLGIAVDFCPIGIGRDGVHALGVGRDRAYALGIGRVGLRPRGQEWLALICSASPSGPYQLGVPSRSFPVGTDRLGQEGVAQADLAYCQSGNPVGVGPYSRAAFLVRVPTRPSGRGYRFSGRIVVSACCYVPRPVQSRAIAVLPAGPNLRRSGLVRDPGFMNPTPLVTNKKYIFYISFS